MPWTAPGTLQRGRPAPEPAPGRTPVRVTAAPVVPLDLLCASGTSYSGRPAVPYVPGVQGVGVVERSDVLPAGARVWFATSAGMAIGLGGAIALEHDLPVIAVPTTCADCSRRAGPAGRPGT